MLGLDGSGGVGKEWAEGRDAAGYPTMLLDTPPPTKNCLAPNVSSAEAEKLVPQRMSSVKGAVN